MPETSAPQPAAPTSTNPSTPSSQRRSRPPGELGGHTVMPWEQGETGAHPASSHIPAGSDPATTASGGSSKSVPPPSQGAGRDGLGQGAGTGTVKAADGMMPPASESAGVAPPAPSSSKPPAGSAGAPAKPAAQASLQPLEEGHPEGMEGAVRPSATGEAVAAGDAPREAMAGAPPSARNATAQASKRAGGSAPLSKPSPAAVDATAKASAPSGPKAPIKARERVPSPMVPSTGADAAKAASGAAIHPSDPAMQATSGQRDPEEDALIRAIDERLAALLARALHETVASAVRQARAPQRPTAPAPVKQEARREGPGWGT